jgi:hypothetical protein
VLLGRRYAPRVLAGAVILLTTHLPASGTLAAQIDAPRPTCRAGFFWGVDVGTATASAVLQGRAHGVSVLRAVIGGVAGGTAMYAGQRLIGTGQPALRFVGLQTVATGASLARNLGTGRGPFAELTFPLFPLYLRVHTAGRPHVDVRLSVVALGGIVHTAREFRAWPDWQESLIAGMPVFGLDASRLGSCLERDRAGRCTESMLGHHVFGAVAFARQPGVLSAGNVLTHELGHAAQDVRDAVLHAIPASDFVLDGDPVGRVLARFFVVDVVLPLNLASRAAGPPDIEPACRGVGTFYECETEAMMTGVR